MQKMMGNKMYIYFRHQKCNSGNWDSTLRSDGLNPPLIDSLLENIPRRQSGFPAQFQKSGCSFSLYWYLSVISTNTLSIQHTCHPLASLLTTTTFAIVCSFLACNRNEQTTYKHMRINGVIARWGLKWTGPLWKTGSRHCSTLTSPPQSFTRWI